MAPLNLLDPSHRHALARERFMLLAKDVTAVTLGAVAFIAMLLTISKALLARDLQDTAERTTILTNRHQPVQQAIRTLNDDLRGIALIADEYTPWSRWFTQFASHVPSGNQIYELGINRTARTLAIKGRSRHRDDLLKFKERLESSGLVDELQFPLSNLLLRENIDFEFTAVLNPYALLAPIPPSPSL